MGFPGNADPERQHAPDRGPVHESDEQRRRDRAPVATNQACDEDVTDEPVDQAACADMIGVPSEKPHRDSRPEVDGGQNAKGRSGIVTWRTTSASRMPQADASE